MEQILNLIEQYGFVIVFLNLFFEQFGFPIPAYPMLLVNGALANTARYNIGMLLSAAVS